MSKKLKTLPFHENVLKQLKKAETGLSKNKRIGLFINHFVIKVGSISEDIIASEIPKEHINELISGLKDFYLDFEDKYPRGENGCGSVKERVRIERYFNNTISNLTARTIL